MKYGLQARTQAKRTSLSQYTFARPPRRLDIVTVGHSSNLMKKNGNLNISSLTQNLENVKEDAAYKSATNYDEFIALGTAHMVSIGWLPEHCTSKLHKDIKSDIDRGYLKVIDPRLTPEIVAELDDGADDTGICYPERLKAKLVLLPKKGDLGQPKNWRGICLLDIASKILSCVMVERLKEVM